MTLVTIEPGTIAESPTPKGASRDADGDHPKRIGKRRHVVALLLILSLATIIYSHVSLTYFCGFDDFLEGRRADLVDRQDLTAIFTTPHFSSFKYRPLNRATNLISYQMHSGDALPFRLRNLAFHELAAVGVYILALLLFESWPVACVAALLFVIHPLTNQNVGGAVMTNTIAHSIFLFSLIFFLLAIRRRRMGLLILSTVCAAINVLFYEAAIVLPALMAAWWAIDSFLTRRLPGLRYILVFAATNSLLFGSYLLLRQHAIHGARATVSAPLSIVKGLIEYGAALSLPIDMVLAHTWFNTPLPSELQAGGIGKAVLLAVASGLAVLGVGGFRFRRQIAAVLANLGWSNILFLLLAMAVSISPLVVFTDHVSETYIYLPAAFFCILLARVLLLVPSAVSRTIAVSSLLFLFCCATWVRNERVCDCGSNAKRVLSGLSLPAFQRGEWTIDVAKTPGTVTPPHYGIYNYHGLDTLGSGDGGIGDYGLKGIESAVQMASRNTEVHVRTHPPSELPADCFPPAGNRACFWVAPDGMVTTLGAGTRVAALGLARDRAR